MLCSHSIENISYYHTSKGQQTHFVAKISIGQKIHTIRSNYDLWAKRLKQVEDGLAYLSVRTWSGKPYNSKQEEQFSFHNTHGVGLESVKIDKDFNFWIEKRKGIHVVVEPGRLAENDGLQTPDFKDWFKSYEINKSMAVIHFTNFRYLTTV